MQYLSVIGLMLLTWHFLSITASSTSTEANCSKNITVTSHKIVTKTRLKTVVKKAFLRKKTETKVEVYEDYEPVHKTEIKWGCCEGYKPNKFNICEPQCIENGCPANSRCVEPEVCECRSGFVSSRSKNDGKHICEPVCQIDCPDHSECIGPNQCACRKGYKVTQENLCVPHCDSDCNSVGECVKPNTCDCPMDYISEQGSCISISETTPYYIDNTESQEFTSDIDMTMKTDTDSTVDDIDSNEAFDEIIPSTTYDPLDDSSTIHNNYGKDKCPDDQVYHKGECHPLKFASLDFDCRFKPCEDKHAICMENGTCACAEGYKWFKTHVVDHDSLNHTIKAICLSATEYANRLQKQQLDGENANQTSWTTILFIVLGVLVMVSALVFLGFRLLHAQTGHLDVEGKCN